MVCRRTVWLLCVLLLLLAGCASSSDATPVGNSSASTSSEASDTSDAAESPDEAADIEPDATSPDLTNPDDTDEPAGDEQDEDSDQPTANDASVSPISQALGFDPDDQVELTNAYIRAAEELVRACMAQAGFEYTPTNPGFAPSFERQLELQASISEERFVREYGYGIASLFELNFQDEGVLAFVEQLLGPPPTEDRSDGEQQAYEIALNGETVQNLDAEELQEEAFEITSGQAAEGSCRYEGYENAENPQGDIFDGFQSLLGDELDALSDRFENDPRIRDAQADWQTCMAGHGYSYEQADKIQDELFGSANAIGEALQQSPEALAIFGAAIDADLSSMDELARYDFLENAGAFQGFTMVPGLQAELDALITFELTVAGHSYDCADRELARTVQHELEQEFVETHAEQLALIVSGDA